MRRSSTRSALFELVSSMRFAISLLTVLAIASIVGTVLKQNEPFNNYIIEFGQFWFALFELLGLFDVYHAGWFLVILGFLVLSVTLCISRQWPGMLRDIRQYREHARASSLRAMPHHAEYSHSFNAGQLAIAVASHWQAHGYRTRSAESENGVVVAAKKGSLQRLGYLLAHAAIVVICIGGLLDGNLLLKIQRVTGSKELETRNIPQSKIPAKSRLSDRNLSFRANVDVPEGASVDVGFITEGRGYLVQELPFSVKLKQFHIEHYSTGQPKLFASDIEVTDKSSGRTTSATVMVNHPLIVDGIAIYQSSFGDGGSPLEFTAWPLAGGQLSTLKATSRDSMPVSFGSRQYTLELGDLRVFNIENMGGTPEAGRNLESILHDARQVRLPKQLRNVGPSIDFKLRDAQGQAREYRNYMVPFTEEDRQYLLSGMRTEVAAPFAYVRFPLDQDGKLDTFMRLKEMLLNPANHAEIARQTAANLSQDPANTPAFRKDFEQSLNFVLARFAEGGFPAMEKFLEDRVPQDKRQQVAQTFIKTLQNATISAMDLAQKRAGLKSIELDSDGKQYRFLMDSLTAISATFDYGSPIYLQLTNFTEVKSSGFQMTRSPGKNLVYLGSLLLVMGIFCMFYVRENRMWLRISGNNALFAFSANRRDVLTEREFEKQRKAMNELIGKDPI